MSISQISSRNSTAVALMQQMSSADSTNKASGDTSDIIKIANGLSIAPGAAAKQASGLAFDFTVSQAVRDGAARNTDEPGSIIVAGVGGGEAVERFDSWEALETRIQTDGKMNEMQKNEWLDKVDYMNKSSQEINEFKNTDIYLAMKSGEYSRIMSESGQFLIAATKSVSEMSTIANGLLGRSLI